MAKGDKPASDLQPSQPMWAGEFGDMLAAFDAQVRGAHVRAHTALLMELANIKDVQVGDVNVPATALMPREVLESSEVTMTFSAFLRDNGVSFTKAPLRCGTKVDITMKWEAGQAPESTALIRTKGESELAKEIKHG